MLKSTKRHFMNLANLRAAEIAAEIEGRDRVFLDLAAKTERVRAKLANQLTPQYRHLFEVYTDHLLDQRLITNRFLYSYGFRDGLRAGRFLRSWRRFNPWRLLKLVGGYLRRLISGRF